DPVYKIPVPRTEMPGAGKAFTEAQANAKATKGFYLATIAHCLECHTPLGPKGREMATRLGAGGFEFPGPWGVSVARNVTASKTRGIGGWTDTEVKKAITQGVRKDGTRLKPPMGYHYYAKMAPADLDAIVGYVRTLPARE